MSDTVGARGVNETAAEMGVNKTRIVQLTNSALRKLRWSNHLKEIKEFIDEYSGQATEA